MFVQLRNATRLTTFCLAMLLTIMFVNIVSASPATAPGTPPPRPSRRPATGGRTQFGPRGAGNIAVWTDRAVAASPQDETELGTSDILGVDFSTNQPIVVSNAPGDQTSPDVSGSVVVWQDNGHSCPTCERDIRAKDVTTGNEFTVASGPADQAMPVIAGRTLCGLKTTAHVSAS